MRAQDSGKLGRWERLSVCSGGRLWAKILREIYNGRSGACAPDLKPPKHGTLDYYLIQNATKTSLHHEAVDGVSLRVEENIRARGKSNNFPLRRAYT